jgi:predicted SnoaL-like aldol condensation-catalyzing enzyme
MKWRFIDRTRSGRQTRGMDNDNTRTLRTMVDHLFRGDLDAVAPFLRDDFTDHGPGIVASGKAEWLGIAAQLPLADMEIEIHRIMAEGDEAFTLSRRWLPWEGHWIAAADFWRFEDGLLAEHGEVFQPLPATARRPEPHSLVPW